MKVAWTHKALLRLKQIHDHIALDQPAIARNFIDRLTRKASHLASVPSSGKIVSRYGRDDIGEPYEGEYRIIYHLRLDRIDILTVRHSARLLPKRVGGL